MSLKFESTATKKKRRMKKNHVTVFDMNSDDVIHYRLAEQEKNEYCYSVTGRKRISEMSKRCRT